MIITCPSCKTQYALPSNAIGAQGKKVKCVKCQHIWQQSPLQEIVEHEKLKELQPEPVKTVPIPPSSNLPSIRKPEKLGFILPLKFACFLVLALFSAAITYRDYLPQLSSVYRLLAMQKTDGLAFQNFSVEKNKEENRLKFSIHGDIVNESNESRELPKVIATVYSKGGRAMGKYVLEIPHTVLEPGEKKHIAPELSEISGNAEKITIDMGNWWELLLR